MNRVKVVLVVLLAFVVTSLVAVSVVFAQEASVADGITAVVDAAKTGKWLGIISSAIWLLVTLMKLPKLGGIMKKIPKRWRSFVPVALGAVAGVLASKLGGMSWVDALVIGLLSGPGAIVLHEVFIEALLNKSKSRAPAIE